MNLNAPHGGVEARSARHRREQGTALVEFAFVLPLLLVLALCVVDMGRAFQVKNVAVQAAREGARTAVLYTATMAPDTARSHAQTVVDAAGVTMTNCTFQDLGNKQWQVTVTVQFNSIFPALFSLVSSNFTGPVALTAASVMRKEGF